MYSFDIQNILTYTYWSLLLVFLCVQRRYCRRRRRRMWHNSQSFHHYVVYFIQYCIRRKPANVHAYIPFCWPFIFSTFHYTGMCVCVVVHPFHSFADKWIVLWENARERLRGIEIPLLIITYIPIRICICSTNSRRFYCHRSWWQMGNVGVIFHASWICWWEIE